MCVGVCHLPSQIGQLSWPLGVAGRDHVDGRQSGKVGVEAQRVGDGERDVLVLVEVGTKRGETLLHLRILLVGFVQRQGN